MKTTKQMSLSALLIGLGVVIPLIMPVKIMIPPASYTLASHVPVMIAMFISPATAIAVTLGTALGFLFTATDVIAMRALSHLGFAILGSLYIQKTRKTLRNSRSNLIFNIIIGLIHAGLEALVVSYYFLNGSISGDSFFIVVVLLVGFGGFIHSLIDYFISSTLARRLNLM